MRINGKNVELRNILFDLVAVLPMLIWGVVSVAAVVAYGRMQWLAPISCAVYSSVLCAIATIQLWRRTHLRAAIYIVIDRPGSPRSTPALCRPCRTPNILAIVSMLVSFAWGVMCLVVNSTAIAPAKALESYPCNGECGGCTADPFCHAWAANLTATSPMVNICPPARGHVSDDSNATFSCLADGAWMLLTAVLTLFWLGCLQLRPASSPAPIGSSGHEISMATGAPADSA
jgi:nitrate reductase NapE component